MPILRHRPENRLAVVGFLAFVVLALFARESRGEASFGVGVSATSSDGLGYESTYPGVTVQGDYSRGMFVSRAEASYLFAEKSETGDGNGQSALALAGVRWRSLDLMAGAAYSRQETSAWAKDATRYAAELGWSRKLFRAALIYSGNGGAERLQSLGLRVGGGNRLRAFVQYERIRFTSYWGENRTGHKVVGSWLWSFAT